MSGVTFSDSDSAPAPHFKTPAPVPTPKNFQTSTPTPVNTLPSRLTHIKVYCPFCLMRQNLCRGYFAFDRTQMVEMVT